MRIEIGHEKLLTYGEAARLLPKGSRPSYSTFYRWWHNGIRGVRLETVLIGGKRFTTASAMQRFADALSASESGQFSERSCPRRFERDQRNAEAQLRNNKIL